FLVPVVRRRLRGHHEGQLPAVSRLVLGPGGQDGGGDQEDEEGKEQATAPLHWRPPEPAEPRAPGPQRVRPYGVQNRRETGEVSAKLLKPFADCQARWQAAQCSATTSRSAGTSRGHRSTAIGHLGWKTQPEGGFSGLGTSPPSTTRSRVASTTGS